MAKDYTLKASGLRLSGSAHQQPEGSMVVAKNVVFAGEDELAPRRGLRTEAQPTPYPVLSWAPFRGGRVAVCQGAGEHDRDLSVQPSVGASWQGVALPDYRRQFDETTARARFMEAAKNLYITSANGLFVLHDTSGDGVRMAGLAMPPPPMPNGHMFTSTGFLPPDSAVAYRVVIGLRDGSGNLHLSPPSGRMVKRNVRYEVRLQRASGTVTATLESPNKFQEGIETDQPTLNSPIYINPIDANNPAPSQKLTTGLGTQSTAVYSQAGADYASTSGYTLDRGNSNEKLFIRLPRWVTTEHIVQIYRSAIVAGAMEEPSDEMALVYERSPTAGEVVNMTMDYTDSTPDSLRGAALYCSPSRGGIQRANEEPPACADAVVFNSHAIYINTKSRHRLRVRLLAVGGTQGLQNNDIIRIGHLTYKAALYSLGKDSTQQFYISEDPDPATAIRDTAKYLVDFINIDNRMSGSGIRYQAHYLSGPNDAPGDILIEAEVIGEAVGTGVLSDGFDISVSPARDCFSEPIPETLSSAVSSLSRDGSVVTLTTSSPHGLLAGQRVYVWNEGAAANRAPAPDASFPMGLRTLTSVTSTTLTYEEQSGFVGVATSSNATYKVMAATRLSDNNRQTNGLRISKYGEPESAPLANTRQVGSASNAILRAAVVGQTCFLLATEGLFALEGTSETNMAVREVDRTLVCLAPETAVALDNRLVFLSTKGVVSVSRSGTAIISEQVQPLINELLATDSANVAKWASACAYESEGLYILSLRNWVGAAPLALVYDIKRRAWPGTWDKAFVSARVVNDVLYGSSSAGGMLAERKSRSSLDYADEEYDVTLSGIDPAAWSVQVYGVSPQADDLIWQTSTGAWARVESVTEDGAVLDRFPGAFSASSAVLFRPVAVEQQWSVRSATAPDASKHFQEARLLLGDSDFDRLSLLFCTRYAPEGEGWVVDGKDIDPGTGLTRGLQEFGDSAPVVYRVPMPRNAKRAVLVRVKLRHAVARERVSYLGLTLPYLGGSDIKTERK